ncbi:hypothetical protein XENTR_v10013415 [Xenopus tropicalis]|nr:hypothetical protein XENTR_v10013415 [Xenopus tropicalis]
MKSKTNTFCKEVNQCLCPLELLIRSTNQDLRLSLQNMAQLAIWELDHTCRKADNYQKSSGNWSEEGWHRHGTRVCNIRCYC